MPAHAMSPIGGVGINLAVQDAVAAANILAAPLAAGRVSLDDLAAVQKRRSFPTRATQWLQSRSRTESSAGCSRGRPGQPCRGRFACSVSIRYCSEFLLGWSASGFRPEHVRTPDVAKSV